MLEGGALHISTKNIYVEHASLLPETDIASGDYIEICIEDTGMGMDEVVRAQLFEPFYTTKFQGRGLGMAAAHGIVQSHQGAILVESERGKGSVFKVLLPVLEKDESPSVIQRRRVLESYAGTEHILLIDDDLTVLKVIQPLLKNWGYEVSVATNGSAAIELLKAKRYDLALLDLNLPDYSGHALFLKLRENVEDLPILMMSGSLLNSDEEALISSGKCNFLAKPFVPNELGSMIRQLVT